jgi:integrase
MGIYKKQGKDNKETWYIDYYADGRRVREAIGSKTAAKGALAARQVDILRGEFRFKKEKKIRFADFAKEYLEYAKVNKRSWQRDESSLKRLLPHFKDKLLSKVGFQDIEDYKTARLKDGVQPATINRELICLQAIFTIAKKKGKLDGENPVKGIKSLEERKLEMKILGKDEAQCLIEASSGYLRFMIILALNTAMRKGEILNLRWKNIDFDECYLYIAQTKSNVPRKVPMNSMVKAALSGIKKEGEFVFLNPKTKTRFRDVPYRSWKNICKKIGRPDLRFHDLRHTAGTWMVTGGIDLVSVKEILGHASIQQTMQYCHPTPENRRRAVDVLASVFELSRGRADQPKNIVINQPHEENSEAINPLLSERKAS